MSNFNPAFNRTTVKKLLSTWLASIRLEELANARVEVGDHSEQNIWERDIGLVGDRLLLDKALFQDLKQKLTTLQQRGSEDDFQIAVAFPRIYSIEDQRRHFHPLFTIDISPIFAGEYSKRGWDLTESFEFQPVLPNLMEFAFLEEEEAEKLVIREGLKTFLSETFKYPFTTLQQFLERVSLPDAPVRSQPLPYLLQFSFVPYTYNLKKDLRKILQQEHWEWFRPGHPAYEYLAGRPQDPDREVFFAGAFPLKPLTASQASVIKHFCSNALTATIGAPGTGKTHLIAHATAIGVTKRAIRLAEGKTDRSNLTLITSTNNRAVQNVEALFAERFEDEFFYLSGGARGLMEQVISRLQLAVSWLKNSSFDSAEREQLSNELLSRYRQLQQAQADEPFLRSQHQADLRSLEQLNGDIQALENHAANLTADQQRYAEFPIQNYQNIEACLARIEQTETLQQSSSRRQRSRNWLDRVWQTIRSWWQQITGTRKRSRHHLYDEIERLAMETHQTPFPFYLRLPLTLETIRETRSQILTQIEQAQAYHQQAHTQTTRDTYLAQKTRLEQRIANYPTQDFCDRFYTEFHTIQQELFELSIRLLQQEALRRQEGVIQSLNLYIDVLSNDWDARRRFARSWRSVYQDLSLLFPVMISTLHSLRNLIPFPDSGCIDQVFADEAGAIALHQLFPALVRAQKALVVGDPQQLPPTLSFSDATLASFRQTEFLDQGLTDDDYDDFSPTAVYTANAYLRAAGASQRQGDDGNGIILKEHFRCPPVIAQFVDHLGNYGLEIKTEPIEPVLGTHLIGCHVEGNYRNHTNHDEISAIAAWVEHLYSLGYSFDTSDLQKTIGILTPYRHQANALRKALQSRWKACSRENTGTVHTYQGGQKAILIFSTCRCRSTESSRFLNRRPNLLNVAISRTQETFILVGNLNYLQQEGSYTQMLVDYIEQHGNLRQIHYSSRKNS